MKNNSFETQAMQGGANIEQQGNILENAKNFVSNLFKLDEIGLQGRFDTNKGYSPKIEQ